MITIWARAELNTGLIAASIPPLKAIFESLLKQFFGVSSRTHLSTAGGACYGANASFKQSRMSRHSQHRILPEEDTSSGPEFAMVSIKFRPDAKEKERDADSLQL